MKLKFKHQAYQADAVRAVVDCFQDQPKSRGLKYAIDPGAASSKGFVPLPGTEAEGFANAAIAVFPADILKSLQEIQRGQGIGVSDNPIPQFPRSRPPATTVTLPPIIIHSSESLTISPRQAAHRLTASVVSGLLLAGRHCTPSAHDSSPENPLRLPRHLPDRA
jgi:hypothetical protein